MRLTSSYTRIQTKVRRTGAKQPVYVDLDDVIADYSDGWQGIEHFGEPIEGAKEFLEELQKIAKVVIYTTRTKEGMDDRDGADIEVLKSHVVHYLDDHELPYDEIYTGQGKPGGIAYIDDKAVSCQPRHNPNAYGEALEKVRGLIDNEKE